MSVDLWRLGRVLGDRLLVRRLNRPERQRGLYLPAERVAGTVKEQQVWWGVVEAFGLDSRYGEAYALKVGDLVGFVDVGGHSADFEGSDGETRLWVAEEFACVVDAGRQAALRTDADFSGPGPGLRPIGPYLLVRPDPIEEKRGGVVLPHALRSKTRTGRVVAMSEGTLRGDELHPSKVTPDVDVLFGQYAGCWARFPAAEFLLAKEEDLIAELYPVKDPAHV